MSSDPPTAEPRGPAPCRECDQVLMASDVQTVRQELEDLAGSTDKRQRALGLAFTVAQLYDLRSSEVMEHPEMLPVADALEHAESLLEEVHGVLSVMLGESNHITRYKVPDGPVPTLPQGSDDEDVGLCANCAYDG